MKLCLQLYSRRHLKEQGHLGKGLGNKKQLFNSLENSFSET